MTSVYVLAADFDTYVADEFGATEASLRLGALLAAETAINDHCQRSFPVASTSSARVYVPNGTDVLRIHDCTTVTSVTYDGTVVAAGEYQLEPVNQLSWSGAARPYEQVRRLGTIWPQRYGKAIVSVVAAWGWAAVPDAVVEATKITGKDILQQRRTVGNMAVAGDFASTVKLNTYVRKLLQPLCRGEAFGI